MYIHMYVNCLHIHNSVCSAYIFFDSACASIKAALVLIVSAKVLFPVSHTSYVNSWRLKCVNSFHGMLKMRA